MALTNRKFPLKIKKARFELWIHFPCLFFFFSCVIVNKTRIVVSAGSGCNTQYRGVVIYLKPGWHLQQIALLFIMLPCTLETFLQWQVWRAQPARRGEAEDSAEEAQPSCASYKAFCFLGLFFSGCQRLLDVFTLNVFMWCSGQVMGANYCMHFSNRVW